MQVDTRRVNILLHFEQILTLIESESHADAVRYRQNCNAGLAARRAKPVPHVSSGIGGHASAQGAPRPSR
ncbi:hypothetical protein [Hydrogenophaga sp. PAMC20947]|uniref:hypothetical protein n=1 Tax=Hydrogenophaga sp. PAMC20947 TaxID=2565558 RepID=UPI00109DFD12|nr:hypothetical protein [Hydrogenophaga sp. PAMC20947]QCB47527.1 hypothetical protein E5678_16745 [Hydrogenophaga sp. PAMC20947]